MASNVKVLDPVQGLIDYVEDIKPYHTKVIESLVEYVSQETVNVNLLEEYLLDIAIAYSYDITNISCMDGGFGSLGFDDPDVFPVLSPDLSKTLAEFPAFTSNSLTLLGDQRTTFNPNSNLTFKIVSFTEYMIIDAIPSTGSPAITGGGFKLFGNKTSKFSVNDIFIVTGSVYNDGAYKITNVSWDGTATTLLVGNQTVKSNEVSGFIKVLDTNNTGSFTIVNSIYVSGLGNNLINEYTKIFITGLSLVPPAENADNNERYISLVSIGQLEYKKVLSYSNALRYYNTSAPASLLQTPDEGTVYAPIVNLSQGSPSYFVVEGTFESSNMFVGDEFSVVGSTDNNDTYIIESIAHIFEPLINDDATRIGVASIHDPNIDGFAKLDIPANVFIVDGNYSNFFKQGIRIKVISGNKAGIYTVLGSKFINGETQIRVHEDIIGHERGRLIAGTITTPSNAFLLEGDLTKIFKVGSQFNIVSSVRNNGFYTVAAVGSPSGSSYNPSTHKTTIFIEEEFDSADSTGEIHEFIKGTLTYLAPGFGETPELCEVVPETLINVGIKDKLHIDGYGVWASDDILAYGINEGGLGYDLPLTIFASGGGSPLTPPTIAISTTAPVSPVEDTLWFDISENTGSPTAPGTLKIYTLLLAGSPAAGWLEVPRNKIYWNDTDTGYMYYRLMYQYYDNSVPGYTTPTTANNLDTGWILEYTKIPGFNEVITASTIRQQVGFETFFAVESGYYVAQTEFELTAVYGSPAVPLTIPLTGSPAVPDTDMIEVYVNGSRGSINVLSATRFEILSPRLRIDDFIEARIFGNVGLRTNAFVGTFDADASIEETFDMLKGYKFNIDGTASSGSPEVNTIYIPDTQSGDVFNIFKPSVGSPLTPTLTDTVLEITNSAGSPNIDGIYTILDATQYGSPNSHVVLTVAETLLNTGIFGGSPLVESGDALYQQWFQYMIVNTTANTIVVLGDATGDILNGSPTDTIRVVHSTNVGSPEIDNDGIYTVSGALTYDGRNTTIPTVETITNIGNSGGWVESI